MILDDLSPDAAEIDLIGWPWHGRLELAVGAPSNQSRIVMPSRTIVNGDPVSDNPDDGSWTIALGGDQSNSTFLWAPPGLADLADELVEEQGGAWWGKAILRGTLLNAYGDFRPARAAPGEPAGVSWPVWLDGKKGQAHFYAQSGDLLLRIIEDDAISAAAPAATAYVAEVASIDLQQSTPAYYVDGALVTASQIGLSIVDMTPDGGSILLYVLSRNLANPISRSERTGLVRLDITGSAGSYGGALSVVLSRADFVGTLVEAGPESLPSTPWYVAPSEQTETVSPWPACGANVTRRDGAIGPYGFYPGAGLSYSGYDGSGTRQIGITGVVCNAWFGSAGDVKVIRYDGLLTEQVSNARTDESSGEYEYRETWTDNGTNCELTSTTETNTIEYAISGTATSDLEVTVRLYGPDGLLADQITIRALEEISAHYNGTTAEVTGTQTRKRYLNGGLIAEHTFDSVPPAGWGLPPGSPTAFGYQFSLGDPLMSSRYRIVGDAFPDSIGVFAQAAVMDGSNKASLLGSLYRIDSGANQIASSTTVTPAGAVDDAFSISHTFAAAPHSLANAEALRMFLRAYNPVTGVLARAWPDLQRVSWV